MINNNKVVDFHHHVTPPEYINEMKKLGISGNTGIKFKKWNSKKNLKAMKMAKIDKAMLSISTPGVYVKDDATSAKIARICNDYIKSIIEKYPDRFGGFGILPYPALKESLTEIDYIFDTLQLDGIGFLTNVGRNYFGEPGYDELFKELNKRHATVFIHPDDLLIHKSEYMPITGYYERCLSTVRTGYNLLLNGYLEKFTNIKFIFAHGGGGLPVLARKIVTEYFRKNNLTYNEGLFEEKLSLLKNCYYELAQKGIALLNSLRSFCSSNHIVFGSDIPYNLPQEAIMNHKEIKAYKGFSKDEKSTIYNGSAINKFNKKEVPDKNPEQEKNKNFL